MTPERVSRSLLALPWIVGLALLTLAAPASAIQFNRICSDKIYIETGTDNKGMYIGYAITTTI